MSYQQQNMDDFDYMAGGHEMADEIDDGGDGELGEDEFEMVCFLSFPSVLALYWGKNWLVCILRAIL